MEVDKCVIGIDCTSHRLGGVEILTFVFRTGIPPSPLREENLLLYISGIYLWAFYQFSSILQNFNSRMQARHL